MVVFAFVLALFHNHQGVGVIFDTGGQSLTVSTFLVAMFMSLYVTLRWVHPRWHTPIGACIAVGVLAFIPMLQYAGAAIVAIAAMIYLSYLICNLAVIRARLRGWPRAAAPFSLAKWGIPITALGLASHSEQPDSEPDGQAAELPLELAERPADPVDGRNLHCSGGRGLLRSRAAHEACAPSGARGGGIRGTGARAGSGVDGLAMPG